MATAAPQKKKREEETDLRVTINQWLEMISESRKGIAAADIGKFEAIGKKSLEGKEKQQVAAAEETKKRQESAPASRLDMSTKPGRALNRIVVERRPGEETYVNRMIDLAEQFELAAQEQRKPKDVKFRKFVEG